MDVQSLMNPLLELNTALRGGEYEKFAQGILVGCFVASAFGWGAKLLSSGVRSLSERHMLRFYGYVLSIARYIVKLVWEPGARDIEKIRTLTPWGKAVKWGIVSSAAVCGVYFFIVGVSVNALATLRFNSIPFEVYAKAVFWSFCSLVLARMYFNDIKRHWPIA